MQFDQCTEVVKEVKNLKGFSNNTDALVAISGLCQVEGTNRNSGGRVVYTYKKYYFKWQ